MLNNSEVLHCNKEESDALKQYCFIYAKNEDNFQKLLNLVLEMRIEWLNEKNIKVVDDIVLTKDIELKPAFGYKQSYLKGSRFLVIEGERMDMATSKILFNDKLSKKYPESPKGLDVIQHVKVFYRNGEGYISNGFNYPKPEEEYALIFRKQNHDELELIDIQPIKEHIDIKNTTQTLYRHFHNLAHIEEWLFKQNVILTQNFIEKHVLPIESLEEILFKNLLSSYIGNRNICNKRTIRKFRRDIFTFMPTLRDYIGVSNLAEKGVLDMFEEFERLYKSLLLRYSKEEIEKIAHKEYKA